MEAAERIAAALERMVALQELQLEKTAKADESFTQMVRLIQEMDHRSRLQDFRVEHFGPSN